LPNPGLRDVFPVAGTLAMDIIMIAANPMEPYVPLLEFNPVSGSRAGEDEFVTFKIKWHETVNIIWHTRPLKSGSGAGDCH